MIVAMDIDGVVTDAPNAWRMVRQVLRGCGYKVVFITGAEQPDDKPAKCGILPDEAIFTCNPGEFKTDCAARHGIKVDVWIDDMPGTIEPQRKLQPLTDTDRL